MGVPFDNRVCEHAEILNMNINFDPIGSGNPTTWKVQLSATFIQYDANGYSLGIAQSNNAPNAKVPFCILAEGIPVKPTYSQIVDAMFQGKDQFKTWVAQQIYNLSGEIIDGYEVTIDNVVTNSVNNPVSI
jgi:hypothetical protein